LDRPAEGSGATKAVREKGMAKATQTDQLSFQPGVAERLGVYVYLLVDPRDGKVFYVGKGRGDRVYQHANASLTSPAPDDLLGLKLRRIGEIHKAGKDVHVDIIRHGMTDEQAYDVEAAVIDALKLAGADLTNAVAGLHSEFGWRPIEQLIARYAAHPVTIPDTEPVLLIRPNSLWRAASTESQRYEAIRGDWAVDIRRCRKARWAFAVIDGVVRGVFRIDDWTRLPGGRRCRFAGEHDDQMEQRYLWADVSAYLPPGAQNPVRYVNC
jgi:uncharacterized protein